ncbi:MAG TPA: TonB family protein [Thermoanaerobaculia bacterium]|nr:TonB family protein [Thermoanaerobaculia bacterium]
MSENILVVEYEPRYTDRVRQALAGQPFTPTFAKDGEEAIRVLDGSPPRLIVLSSVVPKVSTTELIRNIRGRKPLQETPILLTVSGYNGKSPKADAQRVGASDILPKPYSESEFLGKVQQMLGIRADAPLHDEFTVRPAEPGLTSTEIFGDLLEDEKPAAPRKTMMGKSTSEVDKMVADTLSGLMPQRRKEAQPAAPVPPPSAAPPAQQAKAPRTSTSGLDKMLSDTLSGLEKSARKTTSGGNVPVPAPPAPAPAPPPAAPPAPVPEKKFNTARMQAYVPDRVPVSQPVFPQAAPEAARIEEEEPTDGVKFGQYVLIEKIATGGMAEVWKARMRGVEGFQKIVAIKKILPHLSDNQDFVEMFVDEAKLAAQLNHNNIIHIYDLGKIQNSYYIAMEYIDGYDLKAILRRGEERDHPMAVELALFIASKIASALDYAHRKKDFEEREMGLVHRDVSPQNVLISQEGDIKLCDFGIAKAASKASHTQAGALKGKLQYMSPEQAWGRSIDRRSDIFALATVLFEMLTNRKLFTGDSELSILEQVREARVTPPSQFNEEVTPEIDAVVFKALQKDSASRYQTAGEMARDIDQILYTFKPTPTSADLAIYMHRMSSTEPVMIPAPEPEPVAPTPAPAPAPKPAPIAAVPVAAAPAAAARVEPASAAPEPWEQPVRKKSSAVPIIVIGAVVLLALGGVAWMLMKGKSATPAPAVTASAGTQAPAAPATGVAPATTDATATSPATATLDPSLVDQEVQKRLAAERARLEAQARAQQPSATTQTPTTAAVRPQPVAPAPVQQQPPPQQAETTRPAPAPVQQEPAPAPAQQEPAPVPAAPARAAVREGELVAAGTAGLTPPRVLRRGSVPYPPIARMQRVQGTVLTSVLVSESGQVMEVRIIRGVNRPVGLNEAAEQTMRRSTFTPGTVDGVRVKSWITVPVDFKL